MALVTGLILRLQNWYSILTDPTNDRHHNFSCYLGAKCRTEERRATEIWHIFWRWIWLPAAFKRCEWSLWVGRACAKREQGKTPWDVSMW